MADSDSSGWNHPLPILGLFFLVIGSAFAIGYVYHNSMVNDAVVKTRGIITLDGDYDFVCEPANETTARRLEIEREESKLKHERLQLERKAEGK